MNDQIDQSLSVLPLSSRASQANDQRPTLSIFHLHDGKKHIENASLIVSPIYCPSLNYINTNRKKNTTISMKVKALTRSKASTQRECIGDLRKQFTNLDPKHHPMQRAREYQRAVVGAKLERMFAAPLCPGNLEHADAVTATSICRQHLLPLASGSADGVVKLWDLSTRKAMKVYDSGHSRAITGLCFGNGSGSKPPMVYSCSDDAEIRAWNVSSSTTDDDDDNNLSVSSWKTDSSLKCIDHHWTEDGQFSTASNDGICVWNTERASPIQTFTDLWESSDTVHFVAYNPAESHLLGVCTMDNGIGLIDTRHGTALSKTQLRMRSNVLRFNPMEPLNFVVANEDHQCHWFDMRKLESPVRIFKGHTAAVLDIAWSPTGREFVSGSYDKTMRIFNIQGTGSSRDVYHTKRMQRVFCVEYTRDSQFVLSGSDDGNVRLWKSQASAAVGQTMKPREQAALQYRQALVKKYSHTDEVRRISKSRNIPKLIRKQHAQEQLQKDKAQRKLENKAKHSKPGTVKFEAERKKVVVRKVD